MKAKLETFRVQSFITDLKEPLAKGLEGASGPTCPDCHSELGTVCCPPTLEEWFCL